MRVALDTSVLVAGLVEAHPGHAAALPWLVGADRGTVQVVWTVHAYAEAWSVLTRLPLAERLDGEAVVRVLAAVVALAPPEELRLADYQAAAARCARAGARSGALFDALHLVAAERMGVAALLTLNLRDFERFTPAVTVCAPSAIAAPEG